VWEKVIPFALKDSSQFRPGPPYAVDRKKYTADFNEVKSLGGDNVTTPSARTADQTEIALFWSESSPLKWNRIARTVSADQGLDLWENARLFGLLNLALADGYIAMADSKNHYNYWRPVTACTLAESLNDPFHRKLRQLRCLRCRFDCYRVERTSSRAGLAPAEVQRLSRRTFSRTIPKWTVKHPSECRVQHVRFNPERFQQFAVVAVARAL